MYKLNNSELNVLEALWSDCSALGEIVDYLKPMTKWNRNTVLTYLTRMETKGLVIIDRTADPHTYKAALTREECARSERNRLLNRVYSGAAADMLVAFLKETKITAEERDELKKLLDEMEV